MLVTPTSSARCWTDRPAGETQGPKVRRLEGTADARVVGVTAEEPTSINRPDSTVEVVPYDREWPSDFESEAVRVRHVLEASSPTIEHIGSTSIPGMPAKPTIDVLVLVDDVQDVLRHRDVLASIGYDYRPASLTSNDDQLFFRKVGPTGKRTHHMHVVARRSPEGRDYLAFREYLRTHTEDAQAYADVKRQLAEEFASERMRYVDEKARYVDELMARVRVWASRPSDDAGSGASASP